MRFMVKMWITILLTSTKWSNWLEEDSSPDEIKEVREWALGTHSTIQSF